MSISKKLSRAALLVVSVLVLILIVFIPTVLSSLPQLGKTSAATSVSINVDTTKVLLTSKTNLGVTFMQRSLDSWGNAAAIQNGKTLLSGAVNYYNQHIMGFGVDNPEPSSGVYNWSSLDARIATIRSIANSVPVITLCGAPDWMKGGAAGSTDWSKIEVAPLPEHFDDFANLALAVAQRYPDVKYFQVWNEMKGFWSSANNNWDMAAYTQLYNKVYTKLKAFNPDIKIGGPYLVIEGTGSNSGDWSTETPLRQRQKDILTYWATNKLGADFIDLDRTVTDFHDTTYYSNDQLMALTSNFQKVVNDVRAIPGLATLPIWYAEDYFISSPNIPFQAAGLGSMLMYEYKAGVTTSLRWEPEAQPGSDNTNQNLISSTNVAGGGQALPNYTVYKLFHDNFPLGTPITTSTSTDPMVLTMASDKGVLIINQSNAAKTVSINGSTSFNLNTYEVKFVTFVTCTDYNYSAWSACTNSVQTRTVVSGIPAGCTGGPSPLLSQKCIAPICNYTYSDWGPCVNGTQTRTLISTTPVGCSGGPAIKIAQSCTTPVVAPPVVTTPTNIIKNSSFETKDSSGNPINWNLVKRNGQTATLSLDSSTSNDGSVSAKIVIDQKATDNWYVQLLQVPISLSANKTYKISFAAKSDKTRNIAFTIQKNYGNNSQYFGSNTVALTSSWKTYTYTYTMSNDDNNLIFSFNLSGVASTVWLDNVSIVAQ